jgi:hypothetical protein
MKVKGWGGKMKNREEQRPKFTQSCAEGREGGRNRYPLSTAHKPKKTSFQPMYQYHPFRMCNLMPPVNKQHIICSCSSKHGTNQPTIQHLHLIQITSVKSCDLFRFPTISNGTTTTSETPQMQGS